MPIARVVSYWIASIAGAGIVAGLAHFSTYSSSYGRFWEAFWLYTIPIPMAVGMFHIPTQVVGSIICLLLPGRAGRALTALLGILLVVALAYHFTAWRNHDHEHWYYFAFVTVDIIVLFAIGVLVAPLYTPRREVHRA